MHCFEIREKLRNTYLAEIYSWEALNLISARVGFKHLGFVSETSLSI